MIIRKTYQIPYLTHTLFPKTLTALNQDKYYRMDVFFDDGWDTDLPRSTVLHFSGADLNEPYTPEGNMVKRWIKAGFIFCTIYYYQKAFRDLSWQKYTTDAHYVAPPFTQTPYWTEGFGLHTDYYHQLTARAYMIQASLEYSVDKLSQVTDFNINTKQIYFTAKSRGGISCIIWSALSSCKEWYKYQKYCQGIVNSNGFVGSSLTPKQTLGWFRFKNTVNIMTHYLSQTQHRFYHVYNEQDIGDFNLAARLIRVIPYSALHRHAFINFTDIGHVTYTNFNIAAVKAMQQGKTCIFKGQAVKNLAELYAI